MSQPNVEQHKKIKEIYTTSEQWLRNYQTHKLNDDPEMLAALPAVQAAYKSAKEILAKYPQPSPNAASKEQKTGLMDTYNNLKKAWDNSQLIKTALSGGLSIEKAANLVKEANDFIKLCQEGLNAIKDIPFVNQFVPTIQSWIDQAKKALVWANGASRIFGMFQNVSSVWDTLKNLGKGDIAGALPQLNEFKKSAQQFISVAKGILGTNDKVASIQQMLTAAENLIKSGGGILEDKDGNGLPDWYDKIKAMINPFLQQTSLVPGTAVDDTVLAKAREIVAEIEKWLRLAGSLGGFLNKIKELQDTVAKIKKFIDGGKKIADAVKNGDWKTVLEEIMKAYRDLDKLTGFLPFTDIDDKLIAKAQELKKRFEDWLTKFTGMDGDLVAKIAEVKKLVERIQGFIAGAKKLIDAVKNGDWKTVFDSLMTAYRDLDKLTGFIPGTKVDDQLIAKAQELKKKFEDWLTKTTGMGGDLGDKIEEAKKIVARVGGFINGVKGLADAVKNGDWKTVFETLKNSYNEIDKLTGFIPGTDIDDKIIAQVQKLKTDMEAFIAKHLGGTDGNLVNMAEELMELQVKVRGFMNGAKKLVEDVKAGNWPAVFETLKKAWIDLGNTTDLVNFTNLDDKALAQVQKVKKMIDDFLTKTTGVAGLENQIKQVQGWVSTAQKAMNFVKGIVEDVKNGDFVGLFNKITTAWTDISNVKDLFAGTSIDDAILAKIQGMQKDVEAFISKATGGALSGDVANMLKQVQEYKKKIDGVVGFVKVLKGQIENKDFAGAIQTLLKGWSDLSKQTGGFIPGLKIDDILVAKAAEYKKLAEDFLTKYSGGALSGDLLNMVEQIKGYVKTVSSFIDETKVVIEAIKKGDWATVFEKMKSLKDYIDKRKGDIIPGTTIDEELYAKAMQLKDQATEYLAKMLPGGANDANRAHVTGWLKTAGTIVEFFITRKPIANIHEIFDKDNVTINVPAAEKLSKEDEEKMMGELTGGMTTGGTRDKLRVGLQTEMMSVQNIGSQVDSAYQRALQRNISTVNVVATVKDNFEKVIADQQRLVKVIGMVGDLVINIVTVALLPPGAGAVVTNLLKVAKDFSSIKDIISGLIPSTGNAMVDTLIQGGVQILASSLAGKGNEKELAKVGMQDLENQFKILVTEKYEYVKKHVSEMQSYLLDIFKNLGKLNDSSIEEVKSGVLSKIKQWADVAKQIQEKYINDNSPKVDENKAKHKLGRMLYCGWLANNKDIALSDRIIDEFNAFNILKDAGVEIGKGFGDKLARGLGQIFGGWLSFGQDKKLKKLAKFGSDELTALRDEKGWVGVL